MYTAACYDIFLSLCIMQDRVPLLLEKVHVLHLKTTFPGTV